MPKHRPPEDAQIWQIRQRHQRTKPWHYKKTPENHRQKAANPYQQELTLADLEHVQERMKLRELKGELGKIGGLLKTAIASGATAKDQINLYLRKIDSCRMEIQSLIKKMGN